MPSDFFTALSTCKGDDSDLFKTWYSFKFNDFTNHCVQISWEDACNYSNESLEDVQNKEPEIVDTFGKIPYYNTKYCIVMTHDSHGDSNDYIKIPITLIRRIGEK